MKNKIFKILYLTILVCFIFNCKNEVKAKTNQLKSDKNSKSDALVDSNIKYNSTIETKSNYSLELTSLVRKVYKWHNLNFLEDFPYKYENDTIFIGIDWKKYDKNIKLHKETGLFTVDFFKRHKEIANIIDQSIKSATIEWRNERDGIPLWHSGADDWCACQDNPDNYWEFITINKLKIKNNIASFDWTWDKKTVKDKHEYSVTAKKENNVWRIKSLNWQNHNYSIEGFDKVMND